MLHFIVWLAVFLTSLWSRSSLYWRSPAMTSIATRAIIVVSSVLFHWAILLISLLEFVSVEAFCLSVGRRMVSIKPSPGSWYCPSNASSNLLSHCKKSPKCLLNKRFRSSPEESFFSSAFMRFHQSQRGSSFICRNKRTWLPMFTWPVLMENSQRLSYCCPPPWVAPYDGEVYLLSHCTIMLCTELYRPMRETS